MIHAKKNKKGGPYRESGMRKVGNIGKNLFEIIPREVCEFFREDEL